MTPKEKSEQLVHRMMYKIQWSNVKYHTLMEAKECSLITLDMILNNIDFTSMLNGTDEYNYWLEVKQEIEKL
jgi:hypothetical protein